MNISGTAMVNVFIANEPLRGERMVEITQRKTKKDWAKFIKRIAGYSGAS